MKKIDGIVTDKKNILLLLLASIITFFSIIKGLESFNVFYLLIAVIIFYPSLFYFDARLKLDIHEYANYINESSTALGRFARPISGNFKIVLANKYILIEFDIRNFTNCNHKIIIVDKCNNIKYTINLKLGYITSYFGIYKAICDFINYDTNYDDIIDFIQTNAIYKYSKERRVVNCFLDINQASEAELTAIPGVTIAKAKHAIKVRNKQKRFLTMNQFYKAINLDEEFIAQIPTKGNKIILNELPEYKRLGMKQEE